MSPSDVRSTTLGELRAAATAGRLRRRSVKDEIRENLIVRLREKAPIFPGIIGYDETVVRSCRATTSSCSASAARRRVASFAR